MGTRPPHDVAGPIADTPKLHAALRAAWHRHGSPGGLLSFPEPAPALPGPSTGRSAPPGLPRPPLTDADYWRFADWLAPYFDALWLPERSQYGSGNSEVGPHLPQLAAAHDARGRRAGGPRRTFAQRRSRTRPRAAPVRLAALERARRLPGGGPAVPQPGLGREPRHARCRDGQVDRPEGRGGADVRVAGARHPAAAARDGRSDRRPHQPLRARCVLPLPERAAQPDQLELRAVCAPRHGHRRHRAAGERLSRTGGALLRGHPARAHSGRLAEPRARAIDSTTSPAARPHIPSTSTAPSTRARPATSSCSTNRPCARAWACCRSSTTGCCAPGSSTSCARYWTHGGYLNWDTGYGFKRWHAGRTWALAQQGLLAIAASPRFHNRPELGRLGEVHVRPRPDALRAALPAGGRWEGDRAVEPLRRQRGAARAQHPGDVRGADAGQRGARGRARARLDAGSRAAAAVLVRRRHRAPHDHHAALLHGRAAGQPGRVPVRRDGAVPSLRRRSARGVERGRPSLGELRGAGARRRVEGDRHLAASTLGSTAAPADPPAAAPPRPRGSHRPLPDPALRGPVRDAGRHAGARRRARSSSTPRIASRRPTSRRAGRSRAARVAATRSMSCFRRGARPRPSRRCCAEAAGSRSQSRAASAARSPCATSRTSIWRARKPATSLSRPVDRPRATAHILRPRAQSSAPRPGPTLALQLAHGRRFRRLGLAMRIAPAASRQEAAQAARRLRRAGARKRKPS